MNRLFRIDNHFFRLYECNLIGLVIVRLGGFCHSVLDNHLFLKNIIAEYRLDVQKSDRLRAV